MKTNKQEYWYHPQNNRRGLVALILLMLLIPLAFFLLPKYLTKESTDFSQVQKEIEEFENDLESVEEAIPYKTPPKEKEEIPKIPTKLFKFNPNSVTKEELITLGLKPSVANTFINYRNTGAKFYKKEDLKKVYGVTDSDFNRLESYIDFPKKKKAPIEKKPKVKKKEKEKPKRKELTPFTFNPNDASKDTLLKLGLSDKVAQIVLNFRSKGGQFWKKQDFAKIYGVTKEDYTILEPFIYIPKPAPRVVDKSNTPKNIPQSFTVPIKVKVDINNGSVEDWKKLKGIGDMTAKRIVNHRDILGGFISIEQIKSTYNVPDSVIENIQDQLILSPIPDEKKLSINNLSADELRQHPFIKSRQAHVIVNFRTNHGNYKSIEDLAKIKALSPGFIEQIEPYLFFE